MAALSATTRPSMLAVASTATPQLLANTRESQVLAMRAIRFGREGVLVYPPRARRSLRPHGQTHTHPGSRPLFPWAAEHVAERSKPPPV